MNRERKQETEDGDLEKAMVTVPDVGKRSNRRRNSNANWLEKNCGLDKKYRTTCFLALWR